MPIETVPHQLFLFTNTHAALTVEAFAKMHHLPGRLIPVPGAIRAGCGLCFAIPIPEAALWDPYRTEGQLPIEDTALHSLQVFRGAP